MTSCTPSDDVAMLRKDCWSLPTEQWKYNPGRGGAARRRMAGSVESVVSAKVVDGSGRAGSASSGNAVVMAGERNRDSGVAMDVPHPRSGRETVLITSRNNRHEVLRQFHHRMIAWPAMSDLRSKPLAPDVPPGIGSRSGRRDQDRLRGIGPEEIDLTTTIAVPYVQPWTDPAPYIRFMPPALGGSPLATCTQVHKDRITS